MKVKPPLFLLFSLLFVILLACLPSCKKDSFALCANGHDLRFYPAVEATAEEDGRSAYSECVRCHKCFDESGAQVSLEDLALSATGVSNNDTNEDPSCRHEGGNATCLEKAICSICGKSYGRLGAHKKVCVPSPEFLESEATCTRRATYHASCALCGFVYAETFSVGDPLGHVGDATCLERAVCTRCGNLYGPTDQHEFSEKNPTLDNLASPATCVGRATYYKTCSICGKLSNETFSYGTRDPEGHRFHVVYEATDEKTHTLVCSLCGQELLGAHIPDRTGTCLDLALCIDCGQLCPASPHEFSYAFPRADRLATPATCQSPATYFYSCVNCLAIGDTTYPYGPLGKHHFENGSCTVCGERK